jgi:hypothetical protein
MNLLNKYIILSNILKYNELSGYYTYRSFIDNHLPVEDFNRIKFFEKEIFLSVDLDGNITGTLISS